MRKKTSVTCVATLSCLLGLALSAVPAAAQEPAPRFDALQQLNGSVTTLVKRVSQSVVQVIVTSYGPVDQSNGGNTAGSGEHSRNIRRPGAGVNRVTWT